MAIAAQPLAGAADEETSPPTPVVQSEQPSVEPTEPADPPAVDEATPPASPDPAPVDTSPPADPAPTPQAPSASPEPEPAPSPSADEKPTVDQTPTTDPKSDPAPTDKAQAAPPAIVPLATSQSTDIVVTARTIAQPLGVDGSVGTDYSLTVGASFRLFTHTKDDDGPQSAVPDDWATCTISAGGSCTITVPYTNSGGANANKQFWVKQTASAEGTFFSDKLMTGSYNGPGNSSFQVGLTPAMEPNETLNMPLVGAKPTAELGSFGAAANSITNPELVQDCEAGLKVAILMDLSASVTSAQRETFRQSIIGSGGLFEALMDTGSSIAVFTFGTDSPAGDTTNYPIPMALTTGNLATLKSRIQTNASGQRTNWDRGLRAVATGNAANNYDLVLMVTDGAPNNIANKDGTGGVEVLSSNSVTRRSIEAAIYSANAIKAAGTRLVAIGVGNGVADSVSLNLRAISGTAAGSDYYQTKDWSVLNQELKRIASAATCQVPITVTKKVTDVNGNNATVDNGWKISVEASNVSAGTTTLTPSAATQETGSGANPPGQANWVLALTKRDATFTLKVSEDAASKPNYTPSAAECTVGHTNGTSSAFPGSGDLTSVTMTGLKPSDNVTCTFTNKASPASLVVDKTWKIDGVTYTHEEAATVLSEYGASAAPVVAPLPDGVATAKFGTALTPYAIGKKVNVNETLDLGRCSLIDTRYSHGANTGVLPQGGLDITLPAGKTSVMLTNSISCSATLTLVKTVTNNYAGTATADQWKLSATKEGGSTNLVDVVSGTPDATRKVEAGTYAISEAGGPAVGYTWSDLTCTNHESDMVGPSLDTKAVTVANGDQITCTLTNADKKPADLNVSKNVVQKFDRSYLWDITKTGPEGRVYADPETGKATVSYTVDVLPQGSQDSGWFMEGTITVENPNDWLDITVTEVTDVVDVGGDAKCTVTDGVGVTIPKSGSETFDYTCTFATQPKYEGINTATVTWDQAKAHTPSGTASGTAKVEESKWTQTPINKTVTITDDHHTWSPAWTVTADDPYAKLSDTYTIEWTVTEPGCATFANTASVTVPGGETVLASDQAEVEVCRGADLTVTKTIEGSLDRTWPWDIVKTAKGESPYAADPVTGEVTVGYDVTVTPGVPTDSGWDVNGTVSVNNPNDWDVEVTGISDVFEGIDCTVTGVFPASVPANGSSQFVYSCDISAQPAYDATNTATVAWDKTAAHTPTGSASGTADIATAEWDVNKIDDSVTVTDSEFTFDEPWIVKVADGEQTRSYEIDWTVEGEEMCQDFTNTATLDDAQSTADSEQIRACMADGLTVSTSWSGSYTRDHQWSVDKVADQGPFYADPTSGEVTVGYDVTVAPTTHVDSDWAAGGTITVHNPNGWTDIEATIDASLNVDGGAVCTVLGTDANDEVDGFQAVIPGGKDVVVSYACDFSSQPSYTGKATGTATWDAALAHTEAGSATGTTDFAEADWNLTHLNDTVTVTDSEFTFDPEWVVNLADGEQSRSYELTWKVDAGTCKDFPNTATVTGDNGFEKDDEATVKVCRGADLEVGKNVITSFDRSYLWDVTKTANVDGPVAADPETGKVTVSYDVTVTPTGHTDSNWAMTGEITVTNPNTWQSVPVTVLDEVDLGEGASCVVTGIVGQPGVADADPEADGFQATIAKSATVKFAYTCSFTEQPDYAGSNTAKVTWDAESAHTLNGSASKTVDVVKDEWSITPYNDSVTVTDSNHVFDPAWIVDLEDRELTRSYEITWTVDEPGTCVVFDNVATITGADGFTDSDDASVKACRQADLAATVTGWGDFLRTYQWSIDKSLPEGQADHVIADYDGKASVDYSVTVDVVGHTDSEWLIEGQIDVVNPNDYLPVRTTVEADLGLEGAVCTVDESADVDPETDGVQIDLAASAHASVGFGCTLSSLGDDPVTVTAELTWVGGVTTVTSEPIEFDFHSYSRYVAVFDDHGDPEGDATLLDIVHVDDAPAKYDYTVDFEGLLAGCEVVRNTAWIELASPERAPAAAAGIAAEDDGVLDSDQVDVTICPPNKPLTLGVSGSGSFDREYLWTITKRVDATTKVAVNGKAMFDYVVEAIPGGVRDSGYEAGGELVIGNPNREAVVATIGDLVGPEGMECVVTATDADSETDGVQVSVPAGGELAVEFGCTGVPKDLADSGVTGSVTFADSFGTLMKAEAEAAVAFAVDAETNKTVTVFDDQANPAIPRIELGTADWNAEGKATPFSYRMQATLAAGQMKASFTNTAQIGSDGPKASVTVTVLAAPGLPSNGGGAPATGFLPLVALVGLVGLTWVGVRRTRD